MLNQVLLSIYLSGRQETNCEWQKINLLDISLTGTANLRYLCKQGNRTQLLGMYLCNPQTITSVIRNYTRRGHAFKHKSLPSVIPTLTQNQQIHRLKLFRLYFPSTDKHSWKLHHVWVHVHHVGKHNVIHSIKICIWTWEHSANIVLVYIQLVVICTILSIVHTNVCSFFLK